MFATGASVTFVNAESGPGGGKRSPDSSGSVRPSKSPSFKPFDKHSSPSGESNKGRGGHSQRIATDSDKIKDKLATRSGERKAKLTNLSNNLIRRFTNVTERQENILNRANTRIASMSATGTNVADLKARSASISAMIAKQKTSIAALKTTLAAISTSNSSGDSIGKAISDVVKQVTATHKALHDLVKAMGGKGNSSHSSAVRPTKSPKASATVKPSTTPVSSAEPSDEPLSEDEE